LVISVIYFIFKAFQLSIVTMYRLFFVILTQIILFTSCQSQDKNFNTNTMTNLKSYFADTKSVTSVKLPDQLNEISGLACAPDGRIFAHNDEKGIVYQINYQNGKILKSFSLGKKLIREDFEAIAIVENEFYLVTSSGVIYIFKEGEDEEDVKYKKYKTFLSSDNDVEGLCYDPDNNSLLLACKGNPGKKYSGYRTVYEFSLSDKELKKEPRFLISIKDILSDQESGFTSKLSEFFLLTDNTFAPSDIARNPVTGTFFILSFKGRMIVEIDKKGKILGKVQLDAKQHDQPEGITFTKDNDLLISDEGNDKHARITCYPFKK